MTAPKWPTVVFDLDGTVVNTIPLIVASYQHATQSVLGVAADAQEAKGWIGEPLLQTFKRRYPGHDEELIKAYLTWNVANLERLLETFPGIRELLSELRQADVVLGVATSKRRSSAEATLATAGLEHLLQVTVAMEDTEVHKPDPTPLWLALERLGVERENSVYVGDAVVDVQAAQAAGMDAIAVSWGAGAADALASQNPTAVVDSVPQLHRLLLG